ncbi:unnamed protein product [Paramecium octaurelia]|uniref:Uncharacterized protein n=1 Tax=Paramecium octaurelia TaxID=43137 RepID=A0A8S1XCG4_PAROT|nr:unnamed protein product [Paramecium octaurelia]
MLISNFYFYNSDTQFFNARLTLFVSNYYTNLICLFILFTPSGEGRYYFTVKCLFL